MSRPKVGPVLGSDTRKSEDPGGLFGALLRRADRIRRERGVEALSAQDWLARHRAGQVSEALAQAQVTLDRAVEGGFFDEFEGRPRVGESLGLAAIRREMQASAGALLDDPSVEVWIVDEENRDPDRAGENGTWRRRTRLLAVPKSSEG